MVEGEAVVHLTTQYLYDDPNLTVSAVSGAIEPGGAAVRARIRVLSGEGDALVRVRQPRRRRTRGSPLSVILPDGTVERPALGSGDPIDAFAAELAVAVESVEQGIALPQLSGELARQALVICHAEVESVKTRKPVLIQ